MKKLILILLIMFLPVASDGGIFSKKEKEVIPEKICHFQINMGGTLFYIFKVPCGEIKQVGLIDESTQEIIIFNEKLVATGQFKYFTEEKKLEFFDTNWQNVQTVPVFR